MYYIEHLKNIIKGQFFDEFFLMSIATIGAFAIGEYAEGVGVMIFFQLGEFIQDIAIGKTKKSIKALLELKPEFARRQSGEIVLPDNIEKGEILEIRPGEKVPLDCIITKGESTFDTKTITGESIPKNQTEKDKILSGYINITNVIIVKVLSTYKESTISKILEMVQNESTKKTSTENFITKFSKVYTPIVVFSCTTCCVSISINYTELEF